MSSEVSSNQIQQSGRREEARAAAGYSAQPQAACRRLELLVMARIDVGCCVRSILLTDVTHRPPCIRRS